MRTYEVFQNIEKHYYMIGLLNLNPPAPMFHLATSTVVVKLNTDIDNTIIKILIDNISDRHYRVYREKSVLDLTGYWIKQGAHLI